MFSSKFILLALAALALSSVVESLGGDEQRILKKTKKKRKRVQYRVKGTASPDETGVCYQGEYYPKKGSTRLGLFQDCVTSETQFLEDGRLRFTVSTSFTPDDPDADALETTCEITVTPEEGLKEPFNAREKCNNKKGVVSDGLVGSVKLNGKVDNTQFPELTFDLVWTISYKKKKVKKTDPPATDPPATDDPVASPVSAPTRVDDD